MSSAISPVRAVLESYVAGRVKAERVVEVVAAACYGEQGARNTAQLRPVLTVIERAHPGVIELSSTTDKPGFAVRLAERPFPKEFEPALRAAVETVLAGAQHAAPLHESAPSAVAPSNLGFVARLFGAIRRLFTAST